MFAVRDIAAFAPPVLGRPVACTVRDIAVFASPPVAAAHLLEFLACHLGIQVVPPFRNSSGASI